MNELKNNPKSTLHATAVPPGGRASAGAREIRIVAFPKEFQKDYWKSMDRRLLLIFVVSLTFLYGPLLYVASRPRVQANTSLDAKTLSKLGRILKLPDSVMEDILKKPVEEEDKTTSATVNRGAAPSGNVGKASKAAAAKGAAAARAGKASKLAAGKGVLAVVGAQGGPGGKFIANDLSGDSKGYDESLGKMGSIGDQTSVGNTGTLGSRGVVGTTEGIGALGTMLSDEGIGVSITAGEEGGGLIGVGIASVTGGTSGAVSAGDIQAVIDQGATSVNSCYQKELKKSPDLKGKLSVQIKVNPQGRVSGVTTTSNSVGDAVARCVETKIRGWTFPKGKKGVVTVSQTFVFTK